MWSRKVGKIAKPILFNIGLLCSKTFDDAIFEELFEAKYGIVKAEIAKMNIKGVFQIWMRDGAYHEVPLKECHQWTREGCNHCPDFAAEHADISTGGIGKFNDWTLTIVRTELGREIMSRMVSSGAVQTRPGDDDPAAIALMHKLSRRSRKRWPDTAVDLPGLVHPCRRRNRSPPPPRSAVPLRIWGRLRPYPLALQLSTMLAMSAGSGPGFAVSWLFDLLEPGELDRLLDRGVGAIARLGGVRQPGLALGHTRLDEVRPDRRCVVIRSALRPAAGEQHERRRSRLSGHRLLDRLDDCQGTRCT